MTIDIRKLCLLGFSIFVSALVSFCGGATTTTTTTPTTTATTTTTTIQGVAMLGPVAEGEVTAYHMLPDGEPDLTAPLATGTTDVDGNYSLDVPQAELQAGEALVIQLGSGTYTEEASGETVTITPETPVNTVLPIDEGVVKAAEGVVIDAAITPLTNMAYAKSRRDAGIAMIEKAVTAGLIPPEFMDEAQSFRDKGFDRAFFEEHIEFKAVFEEARRSAIFAKSEYRERVTKFCNNANFSVGQAFGIPSPVGTMPANPRYGASNQEGAAYMVAMAAMSQQAFSMGPGIDSIAMMNAYANTFAEQGNFEFKATITIEVKGSRGRSVFMPPPKFDDFVDHFGGIVNGRINMKSDFNMYAPPPDAMDGMGGGRFGPGPGPGGGFYKPPEWASAFNAAANQSGIFNARPMGEAPMGWRPAGMTVRPAFPPPGGVPWMPPPPGAMFNPYAPVSTYGEDGSRMFAPMPGTYGPYMGPEGGFMPPPPTGFGTQFTGPINTAMGDPFAPPPGYMPPPPPPGYMPPPTNTTTEPMPTTTTTEPVPTTTTTEPASTGTATTTTASSTAPAQP